MEACVRRETVNVLTVINKPEPNNYTVTRLYMEVYIYYRPQGSFHEEPLTRRPFIYGNQMMVRQGDPIYIYSKH